MNPQTRKIEIETALKALNVKAKSGTISQAEIKNGHTLLAELADVKAMIKKETDSKNLLQSIADLDPEGTGRAEESGYLRNFAKQLASGIESKITNSGRPYDVKALLAEGSLNVGVQLFRNTYVSDPQPVTSLFEVAPVEKITGEEYSYIRQTQRQNNADVVAVGAVKPTSLYTWERVAGKLKVVAHVSEPIPEYWLKDHAQLKSWVEGEMVYGLMAGIEAQLLSGDGLTGNMTGLLNASGVQLQAYATSKINTVRAAITKVELLGFEADTILMHPTDWESIETATSTTGEFLLANGPVDRSARRMWGVPVVLSLGLTPGQALIVSKGTYGVALDPQFDFQWGRESDDFSRNQVRARAESRADLMVLRPTGIVKVALAAA